MYGENIMQNPNNESSKKTIEIKQNFLSSAICDISSYIQLSDTKVSIIMGAIVAILVGISACYEAFFTAMNKISSCGSLKLIFISLITIGLLSSILVFIFGIMTIKGHSCSINYKSKWFLSNSTCYSFDKFAKDIQEMNDNDIIINMSAELYKLNSIRRQKAQTTKLTLYAFSVFLAAITSIVIISFFIYI